MRQREVRRDLSSNFVLNILGIGPPSNRGNQAIHFGFLGVLENSQQRVHVKFGMGVLIMMIFLGVKFENLNGHTVIEASYGWYVMIG